MMVNPIPLLYDLRDLYHYIQGKVVLKNGMIHFLGLAHYNFVHTSLGCINVSFHIHVGLH